MWNTPSRLRPRAAALAALLRTGRDVAGWGLVAWGLAGCGGESIEVELSVDPAVSTEADLARSLRSLVWILDSPEGLYPPGAEQTAGDVQIENADADVALELVSVIPVDGDRLPVVRIERGGLDASSVDLRILGVEKTDGPPLADGAARGLAFTADARPASVPFNFRDSLRPPRVRTTYPENGAPILGCSVQVLTLVFTRPMDPTSLASAVVVGADGVQTTVHASASGLVADIQFEPPIAGDDIEVELDLQLGTGALAADGTPLDQAGSEPGNQPFSAHLRYECQPPPSYPCDVGTCQWACGDRECLNSEQIACIDGVCTPIACAASCASGTVCAPLRDTCVPDCRSGDALSACASGACDPATGLCPGD